VIHSLRRNRRYAGRGARWGRGARECSSREKRAILFTDSQLENLGAEFLGADNSRASSSVAQPSRGYRGHRSAVPIIYKLPRIEPPCRKRGEGKRAPGTIFVNLRSASGLARARARFAARRILISARKHVIG
jgi:hypothetical protein